MEQREIKVSVIIPVYNAMPYLEKNIEYLLNQTLEEIEIIYIDDKSTDGSLEILKKYSELNEGKIKLVENQDNVGVGISRNTGFELANGEYIAHLDADDYFESNMLELMYKRALETKADVVVCDYIEEDVANHKSYEKRIPNWFVKRWEKDSLLECQDNRRYAINVIPHPTWNKLIRKVFLIKEDIKVQEIRSAADVFFGNAVIVAARTIAYMGKKCSCLMHYRINTGKQITSDSNPYVMNLYYAEKKLHDFIESSAKYRCYRASSFLHLYQTMGFYYERLNIDNKSKLFSYIKENYKQDFNFDTWRKEDFYYPSVYENFKRFYDGDYSIERLEEYQMNIYDEDVFDKLIKYRCLLWGFGKQGKAFYRKCNSKRYKLHCIVDKGKNILKNVHDINIVESISNVPKGMIDVVLVSAYQHVNTITREIREEGYDYPVVDLMPAGILGVPFEECVYVKENV